MNFYHKYVNIVSIGHKHLFEWTALCVSQARNDLICFIIYMHAQDVDEIGDASFCYLRAILF